MNQYGDERVFPVPEEFDAAGEHVMEAHFKLGRHGMIRPRLYYLDAWAKHQMVWVGYVGAHLTNIQTT